MGDFAAQIAKAVMSAAFSPLDYRIAYIAGDEGLRAAELMLFEHDLLESFSAQIACHVRLRTPLVVIKEQAASAFPVTEGTVD